MINVDIVCPVYKNIEQVKRILNCLKNQEDINISKIVCPHTLCGDENIDNQIRDIFKKYNVISFELKQNEFSHSLTRQKAIEEYTSEDIVVFCSQDINFHDTKAIHNLASKINDEVVYAYGKQICLKHNIEKYIRNKNYGDEDIIITKEDIESMQIMAFFASDAFSAIKRDVFIRVGGYQGFDLMMNEDQLYAKIILDAGYKKMYVSNAICEHSHKYTLKQLYKRYYEAGKFYKTVALFEGYKTNSSGFKLAMYVLKQALIHFDILVLLRWPFDMGARYVGLRKGQHYKNKKETN